MKPGPGAYMPEKVFRIQRKNSKNNGFNLSNFYIRICIYYRLIQGLTNLNTVLESNIHFTCLGLDHYLEKKPDHYLTNYLIIYLL